MSDTSGAVALIVRVVAILDELDIPYALGGSLASSFVGEPRATADIDVALDVDLFVLGDGLLDRRQIERRVLVPLPGTPSGV